MDIETRGDSRLLDTYLENLSAPKTYKDPEAIAKFLAIKKSEARKGMSLDPDFAEILCIGIKELGKEGKLLSLAEFADWLKIKDEDGLMNLSKKMITFNGKQFDLPIIIRAGIKAGLNLPYDVLKERCDKYSKNHIDLMQELAVGFGNYKSLDKYLQIYLGVKKVTIDFDTATEDEIRKHCLDDISLTEKLFNKFKPLFV